MISIIKNDLKRLREIIVLFIGILSINFLLSAVSMKKESAIFIFLLIMGTMILVVTIKNYDYLHNKTKATYLASLPFTKNQLFIAKYSSGLLAIMIPITIYYSCYYLVLGIIMPIIPIILFIGIYYSLGCMVGLITGKSIMHAFLYLMITTIPALLYISLLGLFVNFVKGIMGIAIVDSILAIIFPISRLLHAFTDQPLVLDEIFLYVVYGVLIVGISIFIGRYRPMETTGNGLAFPVTDTIIKSTIIICFSWILSTVLSLEKRNILFLFVIHAFITLLLAIIAQISQRKKINILFALMQTIVISLATIVIVTISSDRLEKYIPKDVEEVKILMHNEYLDFESQTDSIRDANGIAVVKEIHKKAISLALDRQHNANPFVYYYSIDDAEGVPARTIAIEYVLKNGDTVSREYQLLESDIKAIETLLGSDSSILESMYSRYKNFTKDIQDTNDVLLGIRDSVKTVTYHLNSEDIKLFNKLLDQELEMEKLKVPTLKIEHCVTLELRQKNMYNYLTDNQQGPAIRAMEKLIKMNNLKQIPGTSFKNERQIN